MKHRIVFLMFVLLLTSNFFNFKYFPIDLIKLLHWLFDLWLIFYFFRCIYKHKIKYIILKRLNFILYLLLVVTISIFSAKIIHNQDINETLRVTLIWYEYLFIFVLIRFDFKSSDIYNAIKYFSFIWMFCWIIGYLSPIVLFDASESFDDAMLGDSRGVVRLKISGGVIMQLWGLWSLSYFIEYKKYRYLNNYIICLIFTILLVSRQHILFYILCGCGYLIYNSPFRKKIIIITIITILIVYIAPKTTIFQNLVSLTESQLAKDDGFENNIRSVAAVYYLTEFEQSPFSILCGNGIYHYNSEYGNKMSDNGLIYGFWLSDIGYVGHYIYFGLAGLLFFYFLFRYVYRLNIPKQYMGIKVFILYLFLTNIFSHSFDSATLITGTVLYVLYREHILYYNRHITSSDNIL